MKFLVALLSLAAVVLAEPEPQPEPGLVYGGAPLAYSTAIATPLGYHSGVLLRGKRSPGLAYSGVPLAYSAAPLAYSGAVAAPIAYSGAVAAPLGYHAGGVLLRGKRSPGLAYAAGPLAAPLAYAASPLTYTATYNTPLAYHGGALLY